MDARDLRVFEAVARLGGMNRAAAELNTVQSNVTARIQALEAEVGCHAVRTPQPWCEPDPGGSPAAALCRRVVAAAGGCMHAARDDGAPRGTLTIGALETTAALRLTPLLTRFAADNPAVDLVLRTGTTCELIGQVLEQRVDARVRLRAGGASRRSKSGRCFARNWCVLAAPHVASLDAALGAGEVRLVVLRAGCSYRQMLEALLARRGIVVQRQMEFGTLEAIFGCVSAGLGITLLPRALVGGVCEAGRVVPTHCRAATRWWIQYACAIATRFVSSALRAFLACASDGLVMAQAA